MMRLFQGNVKIMSKNNGLLRDLDVFNQSSGKYQTIVNNPQGSILKRT